MPMATRVADAFTRVGQEIKLLKSGMGEGSSGGWEYGELANLSETYKASALDASNQSLKIAVLGDSTGDGFTGGLSGGPTDWHDVWPQRLADLLRDQLRLPKGGANWIPAKTPTGQSNYNYVTAQYGPPANAANVVEYSGATGVPGSMLIQEGVFPYADDVTYTLSPGTTSVDVVLNGSAGNVLINGVPYSTSGVARTIRINNPGSTLALIPESGVVYSLLGIYEYTGDENSGVHMLNLSQGGLTAKLMLSWLQDPAFTVQKLIQNFAPDVLLVCLGANDISTGETPIDTTNALGGIGLNIQAVVPGVEVVYIIRPHTGTDANWADLSFRIIRDTPSIGARSYDMDSGTFPSVTDPIAWLSDGQHLNANGCILFAEDVAEYLKVAKTGGGLSETQVQQMLDEKFVVTNTFPQSSAMVPGVLYLRTDG